mmetsp:Transcript_26039/g.47598  ORF Transcript_26039/g.47598 Transcript_26039/m.47598 type:complete len:262 (+) Transcript_26039:3278-4063(+)
MQEGRSLSPATSVALPARRLWRRSAFLSQPHDRLLLVCLRARHHHLLWLLHSLRTLLPFSCLRASPCLRGGGVAGGFIGHGGGRLDLCVLGGSDDGLGTAGGTPDFACFIRRTWDACLVATGISLRLRPLGAPKSNDPPLRRWWNGSFTFTQIWQIPSPPLLAFILFTLPRQTPPPPSPPRLCPFLQLRLSLSPTGRSNPLVLLHLHHFLQMAHPLPHRRCLGQAGCQRLSPWLPDLSVSLLRCFYRRGQLQRRRGTPPCF